MLMAVMVMVFMLIGACRGDPSVVGAAQTFLPTVHAIPFDAAFHTNVPVVSALPGGGDAHNNPPHNSNAPGGNNINGAPNQRFGNPRTVEFSLTITLGGGHVAPGWLDRLKEWAVARNVLKMSASLERGNRMQHLHVRLCVKPVSVN